MSAERARLIARQWAIANEINATAARASFSMDWPHYPEVQALLAESRAITERIHELDAEDES